MTNSATHGGTYYVLRSRVIPGLYKPGIAHNFERRLQQHGGPDKWETVATFYLGPLIARGFELRMLRRFGHRRIGPHPEERMHLADQELAQLLALAEEEQARADAARATVAAGNSTPTTPHAQRQLDHAARWAEQGPRLRPPARPATTAAGAVFMGTPGFETRAVQPPGNPRGRNALLGIGAYLAVVSLFMGPGFALAQLLYGAACFAALFAALVAACWAVDLAWEACIAVAMSWEALKTAFQVVAIRKVRRP